MLVGLHKEAEHVSEFLVHQRKLPHTLYFSCSATNSQPASLLHLTVAEYKKASHDCLFGSHNKIPTDPVPPILEPEHPVQGLSTRFQWFFLFLVVPYLKT